MPTPSPSPSPSRTQHVRPAFAAEQHGAARDSAREDMRDEMRASSPTKEAALYKSRPGPVRKSRSGCTLGPRTASRRSERESEAGSGLPPSPGSDMSA